MTVIPTLCTHTLLNMSCDYECTQNFPVFRSSGSVTDLISWLEADETYTTKENSHHVAVENDEASPPTFEAFKVAQNKITQKRGIF